MATPAPALRGRVAYHGYDVTGAAPGRHRGLPSPFLTLIVTLDRPLTMGRPDGTVVRRDTVVGGLHTETVDVLHDGRQAGIHVALDPPAARALLGLPAGALSATDLDARDVLGALGRELHERVGAAADWPTRFAALDDVLARRLPDDPPPCPPELRWAWRALVGGAGVRAVAREVGWSDRHLGARFRAEFGVTPKVAGRMARFDRARRTIAARALAGAPLALAGVAADAGFADQSHLVREFRALAGVAPTRWLAEEEVGYVQDAPGPPGARSAA